MHMYYTIQAMHAWGDSFLPSYQPFESHHLVGSHKLQWMMKVTGTWLHNTLCTKAYMPQALRRNSLTHTIYSHIYCTHALMMYTITCYVCTWDTLIYTYSSHNCIAGNETSAYNMHSTTECKYVSMQLHPQQHLTVRQCVLGLVL